MCLQSFQVGILVSISISKRKFRFGTPTDALSIENIREPIWCDSSAACGQKSKLGFSLYATLLHRPRTQCQAGVTLTISTARCRPYRWAKIYVSKCELCDVFTRMDAAFILGFHFQVYLTWIKSIGAYSIIGRINKDQVDKKLQSLGFLKNGVASTFNLYIFNSYFFDVDKSFINILKACWTDCWLTVGKQSS